MRCIHRSRPIPWICCDNQVTGGTLQCISSSLGLGLWRGRHQGVEDQWLRWYDAAGDWIPTNRERADRAEQQRLIEAQARQEAIPRLKALGLSVEQIAAALGLSVGEAVDQ
jgi:DNA-binding NarL/FixJ family response regulator